MASIYFLVFKEFQSCHTKLMVIQAMQCILCLTYSSPPAINDTYNLIDQPTTGSHISTKKALLKDIYKTSLAVRLSFAT